LDHCGMVDRKVRRLCQRLWGQASKMTERKNRESIPAG
jgi:hypothetical protein